MICKAIIVVLTLLAVATAGLGISTFFDPILWTAPRDVGRRAYGVMVCRGEMALHYWRFEARPGSKSWRIAIDPFVACQNEVHLGASAYSRRWNNPPLKYKMAVNGRGGGGTLITTDVRFLVWPPAIAFAIYPVLAFIRGPLRRYRRRRRGLCVRCGYNLTGNVSGICPECGTRILQ